jgi:hypothetical protein
MRIACADSAATAVQKIRRPRLVASAENGTRIADINTRARPLRLERLRSTGKVPANDPRFSADYGAIYVPPVLEPQV